MFRKLTAAVILMTFATSLVRADDLFSEVAIESVFSTNSTKSASDPTAKTTFGKRITGISSLRRLMSEADLTPVDVSSTMLSADMAAPETAKGKVTVLIGVEVDEDRLVLGIPLVKVDEKKVSAQKLLELMEAGRNTDAIYFSFSFSENWLSVRRSIGNANVTADLLLAKLNEMVNLLQNTRDTWESEESTVDPTTTAKIETESTTKPATPEKNQASENNTKVQTPSFSLAGLWGATGTRSEGYGLKFDANNKFDIAIVDKGKTSQSSGTYSLSDGKLTLSGEGLTLSGDVTVKSTDEFELRLNNASPLTFRRSK